MSSELSNPQAEGQSLSQRPAYLANTKPEGVGEISQFVRPPRLKIVQPQSRAPFSEMFNKGDVVLVPQMELIAPVLLNDAKKPTDKGSTFGLLPLFFFPDWCIWNPIQMQGKIPVIRERTFNPDSQLAKKAKLMTVEPCPEDPQYNMRYVEHLNFITLFSREGDVSPLQDMNVAVLSFARGNYRSGQTWLSLLQMRKASIYACIFEAHTTMKSNDKGEWYTLDVANPTRIEPWVNDADMHSKLREMHLEYQAAHEKSQLIVEHDDLANDDDGNEFVAPKSGEF